MEQAQDKTYDLITVAQLCMEHVWRLGQYIEDAEQEDDAELVELFSNMRDHSQRGARQCKELLAARLAAE